MQFILTHFSLNVCWKVLFICFPRSGIAGSQSTRLRLENVATLLIRVAVSSTSRMFTARLFIVFPPLETVQVPISRRLEKLMMVQPRDAILLTTRRNRPPLHVTTWINLTDTVLNERSHVLIWRSRPGRMNKVEEKWRNLWVVVTWVYR